MSILNQLKEDLTAIFLTETKCKIRFIYVGVNCKRKKSGVKNVWKFVPLRGGEGGGRRLMAKTILDFHFDYLNPSLRLYAEKPPCHCSSSGLFRYFQLHPIVSPSTSLLLSASQFEHLVIRHLPAAQQLLDQTDHLGVTLRK